jgi:preprotein translocase subunit SecD
MAVVCVLAALASTSCNRCNPLARPDAWVILEYDVALEEGLDQQTVMRQTQEVALRRMEGLGLGQPEVTVEGRQLRVKLDAAAGLQAKQRLALPGRLEFRLVDDNEQELYKQLRPRLEQALNVQIESHLQSFWLTASDELGPNGPITGEEILRGFVDGALAAGVALPPGRELLFQKQPQTNLRMARVWASYLVHIEPLMTGEEIDAAQVDLEESGPAEGMPTVAATLTDRGRERFSTITGENVGSRMAIVLDGRINSAPVIQEQISGGQLRITMGNAASREELQRDAEALATALGAGAFPARLVLLSEDVIGPAE